MADAPSSQPAGIQPPADETMKDSDAAQDSATNLPANGTQDAAAMRPDAPSIPQAATDGPSIDTRLPHKKDASLREFLSKMDDYAPIVSFSSSTIGIIYPS